MSDTPTSRTAAATAASIAKRMRGKEDRLAALLRERGWLAVPPEQADEYAEAHDQWFHGGRAEAG